VTLGRAERRFAAKLRARFSPPLEETLFRLHLIISERSRHTSHKFAHGFARPWR